MSNTGQLQWIEPDWPAPQQVKAVVSTRAGNISTPPYDGFNTAAHVGAPPQQVEQCRKLFQQQFQIKTAPQWLDQVHGVNVITAQPDGLVRQADASYTDQPEIVCTIHTADCLPVFFCDRQGTQVALAHAGWRGLLSGILENTLAHFSCAAADIICWLGPAISQKHFEVGAEVKSAFASKQAIPAGAFQPSGRVSNAGKHFYCDLYSLARQRLNQAGVERVLGGELCTFSDPRFFSYRRQSTTGRILSAIWLTA
ncbi:MAG: multi-copper polyphenol oxidoreductase [Gammaproteobacteria bacterium]|nr:MAG: multi-copper polyphenol oxidoreductase [Gammaproteobacteria bacterium]